MTGSSARILIVAPRVWNGGMELHVSNQAMLYAQHGHKVTLAVHPRFPDETVRKLRLEESAVEAVYLPESAGAPAPVRVWNERRALSRTLAPRSFDYVFCHGFGRSLPWFRRFVAPGGRFLWHEHTDGARSRIVAPGFRPPAPRRYPYLFRRMFRRTNEVLAASEQCAENLRRVQGVRCPIRIVAPLAGTDRVPDAVDRETGGLPLRIGVFGTLHPAKGTLALLHLWPSLSIGEATLHFHGASAIPGLESLARRLGVPAVFHGPYGSAELPALMQATDLALFLSLQEGYGIAAWESMAWGVPFVATATGAAPEFARENANVRMAALEPAAVRCVIEQHVAALRSGRLSRVALQRHQRRLFPAEAAVCAHLALLS